MNRLATTASPYLLQHAHNPVDWYPWGEEALARARAEDKPILLSIGYAACHWCHVMERESFEDAETARLMNERFVSIKVDREERPDLDALYMDAVVALTGHGGWPMTVFLTPEGEPFYGGTYYPPEPRHGLPSFRQVLVALSDAYRERRADVARQGRALVEAIAASAQATPSREPLAESLLADAVRTLRRGFDAAWGGWGRAPKFPPHSVLELLLRRHARTGDSDALDMATETLDAMALGGMHDLVGGGFHRYSVDERWLVPHFEKMLYDNALLASTYLHAWALTGEQRYRGVVERILEYLLRELRLSEGGFASSQDADTAGIEGLTFTWTPEEVAAALGDDAAEAARRFALEPFEDGRSILRGELSDDERKRLLAARSERPQPGLDDKAIAAWNGFALAALAEAGRRLGRADFRRAAEELAEFLLGPLTLANGRPARSMREGRTSGPGFLEDYAAVAHGLYELHLATGDLRWLGEAHRLAVLAVELFADDERGGFFLAGADAEPLVARKKELDDNPTPAGSSLLAEVLLRLARIYGDDELERRAVAALRLVRDLAARAPQGFAYALCALDLHLSPRRELALVGAPDAPVTAAALMPYDPTAAVAWSRGVDDEIAQDVPLLAGKSLVDGQAAVYVCERFACRAPVTEPEALQPATTGER